ncbi:MAG: hypothetical protein WKF84_29535 [Pyrinomonadaceae bacterium]
MRAGPYEVQIGNVLAQIVRPEPCGLREDGLHGKGAAQMAVERVAKVERVYAVL